MSSIYPYIYINTLPKFNMEPENGTEKWWFLKRNLLFHGCHFSGSMLNWLVVSTHLKNISQNGNLLQIGAKIKNV